MALSPSKRRRSAGRDNRQPCPFCRGSGYAAMCDEAELIPRSLGFVGNRTFALSELMTYALVTGGPLRDAIGDMSSIQVGKTLRAIFTSGKSFDGFTLERQGADNAGVRWRVSGSEGGISPSLCPLPRIPRSPKAINPEENTMVSDLEIKRRRRRYRSRQGRFSTIPVLPGGQADHAQPQSERGACRGSGSKRARQRRAVVAGVEVEREVGRLEVLTARLLRADAVRRTEMIDGIVKGNLSCWPSLQPSWKKR